ncbi:MAG: hypothetical protein H6558_13730 [Lewinellaceae bacterium]|nr:hypothetical protein [Lewinellaceae bacterium]MCB9289289.1 hypothetical protein [Lewinellaceae bacterium]
MSLLFKIHLFLSLYMTGLIWFVQVVHYPLMGRVGTERFTTYEQGHTRLTFWVTAPPMLLELATGIALLCFSPFSVVFQVNLAGIVLLWASTFFVQVPLHNQLSEAFRSSAHRRLMNTNWVRTVLWTGRGIVLLVVA